MHNLSFKRMLLAGLYCQFLCTLAAGTNVLAEDFAQAPLERYRVLEWRDLVPDGWEPPLVPKGYDKVSTAHISKGSLVSELDEKLVAIPGYIRPVIFEGNEVSEFLLVPYLPHQVTGHAHIAPNQMIYVYALEPVVVSQPFAPIWVVGAMSLEPVMTDEGPAGYRIV